MIASVPVNGSPLELAACVPVADGELPADGALPDVLAPSTLTLFGDALEPLVVSAEDAGVAEAGASCASALALPCVSEPLVGVLVPCVSVPPAGATLALLLAAGRAGAAGRRDDVAAVLVALVRRDGVVGDRDRHVGVRREPVAWQIVVLPALACVVVGGAWVAVALVDASWRGPWPWPEPWRASWRGPWPSPCLDFARLRLGLVRGPALPVGPFMGDAALVGDAFGTANAADADQGGQDALASHGHSFSTMNWHVPDVALREGERDRSLKVGRIVTGAGFLSGR